MMVVNIFAGAGLKNLWPAINICAFITYTSTWALSPPSNLELFFKQATFFARGDWIPKKQILKWLGQGGDEET